MFSAVYLVCIVNMPCMFFVDTKPYPTEEVCMSEAEANILRNATRPDAAQFTAEYQCINWSKA
jgi:hypothetical protein